MTDQATDRAIKLMSAADRASLRDAQQAWSSPAMVTLFSQWDLKEAVLSAYRRLRKHGQDPDSALYLVLYDYGLERHYP